MFPPKQIASEVKLLREFQRQILQLKDVAVILQKTTSTFDYAAYGATPDDVDYLKDAVNNMVANLELAADQYILKLYR